jgi:response regulator NasT
MAAQRGNGTQRHLLLINRDWLVLAALSEGLRGAGYRVTPSASGEDALAIAARDAPDLALLDAELPDMNGTEVGRRLRQAGVPFLCLSPSANQDIPGRMGEAGAYGYLGKTLDIQRIVPSIETALARAMEVRQLRNTEAGLTAELTDSRETSMAAGLLMMRDRVDRGQAFELLRESARAQRRPLAAVAKEFLDSAEKIHAISKLKGLFRSRKLPDE